jgi:hypothetical protein
MAATPAAAALVATAPRRCSCGIYPHNTSVLSPATTHPSCRATTTAAAATGVEKRCTWHRMVAGMPATMTHLPLLKAPLLLEHPPQVQHTTSCCWRDAGTGAPSTPQPLHTCTTAKETLATKAQSFWALVHPLRKRRLQAHDRPPSGVPLPQLCSHTSGHARAHSA